MTQKQHNTEKNIRILRRADGDETAELIKSYRCLVQPPRPRRVQYAATMDYNAKFSSTVDQKWDSGQRFPYLRHNDAANGYGRSRLAPLADGHLIFSTDAIEIGMKRVDGR